MTDSDFQEWLNEGEFMDSLTVKGFEYVRSDIAAVTKDVQKETFDAIMDKDRDVAENHVKEYVTEVITDVMNGNRNDIGIPFGISQSLSEYGSTDRTPQPQYRGAKYANRFIYEGEAIQSGDKPLYYYVEEGQTGELRKTYKAETKEDGTYVDCISVQDYDDMPEDVSIDRETMVQKTIISPMEEIFRTLGWGTEWMDDAIEDAKSPEDYRDEDQMGFEDCW